MGRCPQPPCHWLAPLFPPHRNTLSSTSIGVADLLLPLEEGRRSAPKQCMLALTSFGVQVGRQLHACLIRADQNQGSTRLLLPAGSNTSCLQGSHPEVGRISPGPNRRVWQLLHSATAAERSEWYLNNVSGSVIPSLHVDYACYLLARH